MTTNNDKSPEITQFLDNTSMKSFNRTRTESMSQNICVMCGNPATTFKDELSKREYAISGMCGTCQDSIWGDI